MASIPAHAPLASFRVVINELTHHPERNSTTILRADILGKSQDEPPSENAGEWVRERTILRRLLPRRPTIDWALMQSCDLWRRTTSATSTSSSSSNGNGEEEEVALIYTPLAYDDDKGEDSEGGVLEARERLRPAKEDEVPFYHPKVRAIAFRFMPTHTKSSDEQTTLSPNEATSQGPFGTIRIDICPFSLPETTGSNHPYPPTHRLTRTTLSLLNTLHAHTWGHAHAYVKRVHHDILVPRELYQDTYLQLKGRHAERIVGSGLWVEKTDPEKHVFEDLGIAAWLMCLWKGMYPTVTVPSLAARDDENDRDRPWMKWARPPGGFVDVGCGNGLLVHLLHLEGYIGFGMDLRERKSWDAWRTDARSRGLGDNIPDLRQVSLDLPSLVLDSSRTQLFPPGSFLIGNHSDEISPWLPLVAITAVASVTLSSADQTEVEVQPAFANIACCPFMLDGTRFGAKHYDYGGEEEVRSLLFGSQAEEGQDSLVQSTTEALLLGPPVDAPSAKPGKSSSSSTGSSRNTAYLQYLSHLHLQAGWAIEKEALRIPSTKNWALVGRRRVWELGGEEGPRREEMEEEIRERIGRLADVARVGWTARIPEGKAGAGLHPPSSSSTASCPGISSLVVGCPTGFGAKTTGGGTATPVYPDTIQDLARYLMSDEPQVIVLKKEFNFIGSEGSAHAPGCAPWGTGPECQDVLELGKNWCNTYEPHAPKLKSITYDAAGPTALTLKSHKTLVGKGSSGVIRGKGLRLAGIENVIIQNIKITEANPKHVWGGDGIDLAGVSNVWIDHVTISEIGRQLMVAHERPNRDVTISNVHFDGATRYSSSCNGQSYWIAKFSGVDDTITLSNNYFSKFMGRAPQVGGEGTSLMHIVNNVWEGSSTEAHAFEVLKGGVILAEGNYVSNTPIVVDKTHGFDSLYAVDSAQMGEACKRVLGRDCRVNVVEDSAQFEFDSGEVLGHGAWALLGSVPGANAAETIREVVGAAAGYGKV
ncbi:hypothetical protein CF327_g6540 [Tilletia walkeri]|nr:hypothetical protein CF327_g6540 [Tilletia walkeri]